MTVHPDTHTLYIAGPMRGYHAFNFAAFDKYREQLRRRGYAVICPAELDREHGFDEHVDEFTPAFGHEVARRDLKALTLVDAVAVLRGFTRSQGARVELTAARWMGLPVVAADDPAIDLTHGVDQWLAGDLPADVLAHEQGIRFGEPAVERDILERTDEAQRHHDNVVALAHRLVEPLDDAGNPGIDDLEFDDDDLVGEALGLVGLRPPDKATEELAPPHPTTSSRRELLMEAADLVDGDRNAQYGDPRQDFARTATMWSAYLDADVEPHDVAALMAMLKVSRLRWSPGKRDSWADLAGYAACGWHCAEELGE